MTKLSWRRRRELEIERRSWRGRVVGAVLLGGLGVFTGLLGACEIAGGDQVRALKGGRVSTSGYMLVIFAVVWIGTSVRDLLRLRRERRSGEGP